MKNVLFLLTALFAFAFTEAKANDGVYLNVFAGPNWLDVSKSSGHNRCREFSVERRRNRRFKAKFDTGFVVGASIGYQGCGCFRGEFEIAYRENKLKKSHDREHLSSRFDSLVSIPSFDRRLKLDGRYESIALMANVFYDIPMECSCWGFYVGGGLGYVDQKFKIKLKHRRDRCDDPCDPLFAFDTSSSDLRRRRPHLKKEHFAAQAILGLSYTFCECMFFDVEYRFFYAKNTNNNALVIGLRSGF